MGDAFNLRRIGIIGGVAWPSTLAYYQAICAGVNAHFAAKGVGQPLPTPPIHIESVNMAHTRSLRGRAEDAASWAGFEAHFRDALQQLKASGCDFALIASTTPHMRLAGIRRDVALPVLSLLESAARCAAANHAQSVLILGTSVTMGAPQMAAAFAKHGVKPNAPLAEDQCQRMQHIIDDDFYGGEGAAARASLLAFCADHAANGQAVVLGCTELMQAFPEHEGEVSFTADGYRFINPVAAHVADTIACALGGPLPA